MSLSRAGRRPARVCGALGLIPALLVSVTLAACSSTAPATRTSAWYAIVQLPGSRGPQAGAPAGPPVGLEDDGIASQRPPRRSQMPPSDDPTEPFSPNYGSVPPAAAGQTVPAPA